MAEKVRSLPAGSGEGGGDARGADSPRSLCLVGAARRFFFDAAFATENTGHQLQGFAGRVGVAGNLVWAVGNRFQGRSGAALLQPEGASPAGQLKTDRAVSKDLLIDFLRHTEGK